MTKIMDDNLAGIAKTLENPDERNKFNVMLEESKKIKMPSTSPKARGRRPPMM